MKSFIKNMAVLVCLWALSFVSAAESRLVAFQGYVKGSDGAVINGRKTVIVEVYSSATSLNPLWILPNEERNVLIQDGVYSVLMDLSGLSAEEFDSDLYVAVSVDGDGPEARLPIRTSVFAIKSEMADSAINAVQSSYALAADSAGISARSNLATNALTSAYADSAGVAVQSSHALVADSAGTSARSTLATSALASAYADSAGVAAQSNHALVADSAETSARSDFATNAAYASNADTATLAREVQLVQTFESTSLKNNVPICDSKNAGKIYLIERGGQGNYSDRLYICHYKFGQAQNVSGDWPNVLNYTWSLIEMLNMNP